MFDINHFIVRLIDGLDDFIKFKMNGSSVAVLGVLNQKHHQESDDRGACINNELPRVGVVEVRPSQNPQNDYEQGAKECPFRSHPIGSLRGEDMKTFFSAGPVCTHADTINKYDDRLGRVVRFIASSGAADGSKVAVRRFILGRPTFSSAKNRTQLRSAEYDVLLTKLRAAGITVDELADSPGVLRCYHALRHSHRNDRDIGCQHKTLIIVLRRSQQSS